MFHVLSEVQTTGGLVQKVKHLLVVDLKERALAEELDQLPILEKGRGSSHMITGRLRGGAAVI